MTAPSVNVKSYLVGMQNVIANLEDILAVTYKYTYKYTIHLPYNPAFLFLGIYPREM